MVQNILFSILLKWSLLNQELCRVCARAFCTTGEQIMQLLFWSAVFIQLNSCCEHVGTLVFSKVYRETTENRIVSLRFLEQSSGSALLKISAFLIYKTRKDYYVFPTILLLSSTVHWLSIHDAFLSRGGSNATPKYYELVSCTTADGSGYPLNVISMCQYSIC